MSNSIKINLLPKEIKKKRIAEKSIVIIIGAVVLIISISVIITGFLMVKATAEEKILKEKQAEVAVVNKEIEKYGIYKDRQTQVEAHKSALNETFKDEVVWHRLANELSMVVPADITLDSMELDETGIITFEGASYEYADVAEFMVRLNDLDLLKNVWLQKVEYKDLDVIETIGSSSSSTSESQKVYGVVFSINAKLKVPVAGTTSSSTSSSSGSSSSQSSSSSSKSSSSNGGQ